MIEARERALEKAEEFEARTGTLRPVFNIIWETDSHVVLAEKGNDSTFYPIGRKSFELLQTICTTPLPLKNMALILYKSEQSIKNQLSGLYRIFGVSHGIGSRNLEHKLIARLAKTGIVSYEPYIDEDSLSS